MEKHPTPSPALKVHETPAKSLRSLDDRAKQAGKLFCTAPSLDAEKDVDLDAAPPPGNTPSNDKATPARRFVPFGNAHPVDSGCNDSELSGYAALG